MQALLARVRLGLEARCWPRCSGSIVAQLGDPEAIVVPDETAELKKGTATAGVARRHAGITGQVENCQTVVFAAYVTARAHVLSDFRLAGAATTRPVPAGTTTMPSSKAAQAT